MFSWPRRVRVRRREEIGIIFRTDMRRAKNTSRGVDCASEASAGSGAHPLSNRSECFDLTIYAICLAALILTPGPMVLAVTQERIYWPLAAAGLALMTAAIRVL